MIEHRGGFSVKVGILADKSIKVMREEVIFRERLQKEIKELVGDEQE